MFLRSGAELSDKIVEVIKKNTRFQYERSLVARSVAERSGAIFIALSKSDSKRNRRDNAGGNVVAIFSGMKQMTSEIALCRDHWKYRSKISLPHIAHLHCRKSRCIAVGF
jgi:hypothetical protein